MKNYLQFEEDDWERTERNWTAWWQGEIGSAHGDDRDDGRPPLFPRHVE